MQQSEPSDGELVAQSLAGNREALVALDAVRKKKARGVSSPGFGCLAYA